MSIIKFLKTTVIVIVAVFGLFLQPVLAEDSECVKCHTDAEKLNKIITDRARGWPQKEGQKEGADPTVLITDEFFDDENHGSIGCEECHGGDPTNPDFKTVHKGVKLAPDNPPTGVCGDCHSDQDHYAQSLHNTLNGMKTALDKRMNPDPAVKAKMESAFSNCARCHATCGQCHVRRPVHGGSGFLAGHAFVKNPPVEDTCGVCHRTDVAEFTGRIENTEADIHHENGMECLDCHSVDELHGDGQEYASRHEVKDKPDCMSCHEAILEDGAENKSTHSMHKGKVSCQVCHSQAYTNCSGCHLGKSWDDKDKVKSWVDFKVGYNPERTEQNPEKVVVLRHVPVTKEMFDKDVPDALSRFNDAPTWKMSSPHNIMRKTPQNQSCNSCHGNWKLFLMRNNVEESERIANRPVIVPPAKVPAKVAESSEEK